MNLFVTQKKVFIYLLENSPELCAKEFGTRARGKLIKIIKHNINDLDIVRKALKSLILLGLNYKIVSKLNFPKLPSEVNNIFFELIFSKDADYELKKGIIGFIGFSNIVGLKTKIPTGCYIGDLIKGHINLLNDDVIINIIKDYCISKDKIPIDCLYKTGSKVNEQLFRSNLVEILCINQSKKTIPVLLDILNSWDIVSDCCMADRTLYYLDKMKADSPLLEDILINKIESLPIGDARKLMLIGLESGLYGSSVDFSIDPIGKAITLLSKIGCEKAISALNDNIMQFSIAFPGPLPENINKDDFNKALTQLGQGSERLILAQLYLASVAIKMRFDKGRVDSQGDYIKDCFTPRYAEEKEVRQWNSDPKFQYILGPLNSGNNIKACEVAERLSKEFGDFELIYWWWAKALMRMKSFDQARQVLLQGLEKSKGKWNLCTRLGEVEWELGNGKEAVYWWAQAMHCQESLDDFGQDSGSYLYLHYFADGLGLSDCASVFIGRADQVRPGMVRLDHSYSQGLRALARNNKGLGIEEVIKGLYEKYFAPSKSKGGDSSQDAEVDRLIRLLDINQNDDHKSREEAAKRLGDIGDPRAIGPLMAATRDILIGVQWAAEEALKKIKGK